MTKIIRLLDTRVVAEHVTGIKDQIEREEEACSRCVFNDGDDCPGSVEQHKAHGVTCYGDPGLHYVKPEFEASAWFERDRQNVALSVNGKEVFSLWDDEVSQAVEDGYLTPPRNARSDAAWLPHLIEYAESRGLL